MAGGEAGPQIPNLGGGNAAPIAHAQHRRFRRERALLRMRGSFCACARPLWAAVGSWPPRGMLRPPHRGGAAASPVPPAVLPDHFPSGSPKLGPLCSPSAITAPPSAAAASRTCSFALRSRRHRRLCLHFRRRISRDFSRCRRQAPPPSSAATNQRPALFPSQPISFERRRQVAPQRAPSQGTSAGASPALEARWQPISARLLSKPANRLRATASNPSAAACALSDGTSAAASPALEALRNQSAPGFF